MEYRALRIYAYMLTAIGVMLAVTGVWMMAVSLLADTLAGLLMSLWPIGAAISFLVAGEAVHAFRAMAISAAESARRLAAIEKLQLEQCHYLSDIASRSP